MSKLLKHIIQGHCRRHGFNSSGSAHAQWRDVLNIISDLSVGRVLRFHKRSNYGFGSSGDVTLRVSWVNGRRRFEGTYFLHPHGSCGPRRIIYSLDHWPSDVASYSRRIQSSNSRFYKTLRIYCVCEPITASTESKRMDLLHGFTWLIKCLLPFHVQFSFFACRNHNLHAIKWWRTARLWG